MKINLAIVFLIVFSVTLLKSQTFTEHLIDDEISKINTISSADFNGDGYMDVLGSAGHFTNDIVWWKNNADGSFTKHIIDSYFKDANNAIAADIDGDGDMDILATAVRNDDIAWWENDGNGNFTKRWVDSNINAPSSVYAHDVDGDGDMDVLGGTSTGIFWWENNGSENFAKRNVDNSYSKASSVSATDINNDGYIDVVGTSSAGSICWWQNNGSQVFTKHTLYNNYKFKGANDSFATDIDSDGDIDIVGISSYHGQYNDYFDFSWWENKGNNSNNSFIKHTLSTGYKGGNDVYATDVDGDGDMDLLTTAYFMYNGTKDISWWENNGSESFAKKTIKSDLNKACSVYAIDMDNDGDMDILGAGSGDILLWEQDNIPTATVSYIDGNEFVTSIIPGQPNQVIGRFELSSISVFGFISADFRLDGCRNGLSNYRLWRSNDAKFNINNVIQLGIVVQHDPGDGNTIRFNNFADALSTSGAYYFITADYADDASCYVQAVLVDNSSIKLSGGTINGSFNNTELAGECYWEGSRHNDWHNADNWNGVVIPNPCNDVVIYSSTPSMPEVEGNTHAYCRNLTIEQGATLAVHTKKAITVKGDFVNNGTLTIDSDATGTGSIIVDGAVSGNINLHRFITSNAWHLVSPLTNSTTANNFFINASNNAWLIKFNEAEGNGTQNNQGEWEYILDLETELDFGKGYSYFVDGQGSANDHTLSFTGPVHNTDISPVITWHDDKHGYNLLGNPYPSALLWDDTWLPTNVEKTIWVWDNGNSNYLIRTTTDTYNIPIGQGFFVKAKAANPTITIPAAKRVHNTQAFLKSTIESAYTNYLTLRANNNQYWDEVKISFQDNGTDGFDDGWDASKMFGSEDAPQLYFDEQDRKQTYNHLPLIAEGEERTVSMSYIPGAEGVQTLTVDMESFHGADVILEDLLTGASHDFKQNPIYAFNGSKDDSPDRFLLHFGWSPDGIGEDEAITSNVNIYSYGKDVYIRSSEDAINQKANVFVYDMLGREILSTQIYGNQLEKITVDVENAYVVVKVVKNGFVETEKVFIK